MADSELSMSLSHWFQISRSLAAISGDGGQGEKHHLHVLSCFQLMLEFFQMTKRVMAGIGKHKVAGSGYAWAFTQPQQILPPFVSVCVCVSTSIFSSYV